MTIRNSCLAALLACALSAPLQAQREEQAALDAVRAKIAELEERLARQSQDRDRATAELRRVELVSAAARDELREVEQRLEAQQREAASLEAQRAAGRRRLEQQRAGLAAQLRLAYMNGRQEALKLLLSQETPADFGRMLVYYDYLGRARAERIGSVVTETQALQRLTEEAKLAAERLTALRTTKAGRLGELEASQRRRVALLSELDQAISVDGGEVEKLRDEEQRLTDLLTELNEALIGFAVNAEEPFPELKGRLAWPVEGDIAGAFGKPRLGTGVRWNGVLLKAERGAAVRAVYHGRVAFADWLAGLGLLLILDHGDGYMTLYGHNDALLKEPGDWVVPGEPIASVGDTGGQVDTGLYFEIRHDGKPIDPRPWIEP